MDYWVCASGERIGLPHDWFYRTPKGRPGNYRCWNCQVEISKADLKEGTDA